MWFKARVSDYEFTVESLVADLTVTDKSHPPKKNGLSNLVWSAPPVGFIKLNVDEVILRNGSNGTLVGS
ncbi:hypothetical protein V6N12_010964 [Hibiscus sabdariffa]|uniref:Uncharacterized protein n=1 Tax=Hibiscus sabdariffa TaxID=183260 RepID=A0ABR2ELM5_9ROSI